MQLLGIGNELIVAGQVTWGVAGQGLIDESRNLKHNALPHRKPVQLTATAAQARYDCIASASVHQ